MTKWSKKNGLNKEAIHSIGNGQLISYLSGPEITQIFGPPYSVPSFMQLQLCDDECVVEYKRKRNKAIWKYNFVLDDQVFAEMTDFTTAKFPCFVRKIESQKEIRFLIIPENSVEMTVNINLINADNLEADLGAKMASGTYVFMNYPVVNPNFYQLLLKGQLELIPGPERDNYYVCLKPGVSYIYIIGGPSFADCRKNTKEVLSLSYQELYQQSSRKWKQFSERKKSFDCLIPDNIPKKERVLDLIDNISILIKTQQAQSGTVIAGYNYHLGYVRDQYGVAKCLLKLGYLEEARDILSFYWKIWQKKGKIHNAQTAGENTIFHVHENDQVEITGYLIIQAFDYYDQSQDEDFLLEILPMLEWAWEQQTKNIKKEMLPFNGDETYIAGGLLPRSRINDGSAEATLLFITAGQKLLCWLEKSGKWKEDRLKKAKKCWLNVKMNFKDNFIEDNKLLTNNPDRIKNNNTQPEFRHGICESCFHFGWTECNQNNRYVCPDCLNQQKQLPRSEVKKYYLEAVSLIPLFIGSDLFSDREIKQLVSPLIKIYKKTGILAASSKKNKAVGYEYGLFLYTLVQLKHHLTDDIFEHLLLLTDPVDNWVEYYDSEQPSGTKCRPWESGINLYAVLEYVLDK